jgi:hypothetical protein
MTTMAAEGPSPRATAAAGAYDRVFYSGMAVLLALLVFAGFAPSYYLRGLGGGAAATVSGTPLSPLVHLHGVVFSAWVVLFLVQTALVARRRLRLHRRLGVAGAVLGAAMIAVGLWTSVVALRAGTAPPGMDPLAFFVVPLFDILLFAAFFAAALLRRRDKEAHKRLMLLAYIAIMLAPLGRLPGVFELGPFALLALDYLLLLVAIAYDLATRRRVHRVYVWGGALLVVCGPGRLLLSGTEAWRAMAGWLAG